MDQTILLHFRSKIDRPLNLHQYPGSNQGRIQDFKLGGGAQLKNMRRAEGSAKNFGVFRVKIHDFTPKKQITESPSYP